MVRAVLVFALVCLAMLLPYLPGRFDSSAAALSMMAQVGSFASLLFVPVGLAWLASPRRQSLWHAAALVVAGIVTFATAMAAAASNQFALGAIAGASGMALLWRARRQPRPASGAGARTRVPVLLVLLPVLLVAFRTTVVTRAADASRDRAIRHSAPLIDAIEAFRTRAGHYPVSLASLNRDVHTGVVGIERFLYESSGAAYNVFFVRPSIELDAKEVVMFNPRDEHRFTSHELDILQYDGEALDLRRGDRRRTPLPQAHWISILFD